MSVIWHCFGGPFAVACNVSVPDYDAGSYGATLSIQRLPSEPIGTMSLTLTNLVPHSAVQIEDQVYTTTFSYTADTGAGTTLTLMLNVQGGGSPLNNLRIKVRKGSVAPYYQPWETLATAVVGAQSIYVAQISDQ
jgi:hypothetical protein